MPPPATPSIAATASLGADAPSVAGCNLGTQIRVGYEGKLAIVQDSPEAPRTRFQAFLEETFPTPQYQIVYRTYFREDIPANVARGVIDFGVMAVDATQAVPWTAGTKAVDQDPLGVEVLTVPVGYAVMAQKHGTHPGAAAPQTWLWFLVPLILVLSATALATVAFVLNFNLPLLRFGRSVATRVDPTLSQWSRAWRWMVTTLEGGVFLVVWCVVGIAVVYQYIDSRVLVTGLDTRKAEAIEKIGALLPTGRHIYEYTGAWRPCDATEACLRDYENEDERALLFGDREHLCHYAASIGVESSLHFVPELAIPRVFAVLLPRSSCLGDRFHSSLSRWEISMRPLANCPTTDNHREARWPFASR